MSINLNTYEEYLLDYIEGKLSPEVEAEMVKFLHSHPDIAAELDGLSQLTIPKPELPYPGKDQLRRKVKQATCSDKELDYLCVAELEDDISEDERARLEELAELSSKVEQLRSLYAHTRILPDVSQVCPGKPSLKRQSLISTRKAIVAATAAAALTAAIIGIYTINKLSLPDNSLPQNQVAERVTNESQPEPSRPNSTITHPQIQPKPESRVEVSPAYKTTTRPVNIDNEELQPIRTNVTELKQIASKEPTIEPIADINPTSLAITGKAQDDVFREKEPVPSIAPSTAKVYTLADIAGLGLKRLANLVGISYNVKADSTNASKHIEVDSRLIAISTTIRKNE
jgi:cytoskeletal protein RodZ